MPARPVIQVSEADLDWLDDAYNTGISYAAMARHLGCDRTTLKRILHRHGIAEFTAAKYQVKEQVEKWERPCSRCGSTKPRPKWQYFCWQCGVVLGHHSEHAVDDQ